MKPETSQPTKISSEIDLRQWLLDNCQLTFDPIKNRVTVQLATEIWLQVQGQLVLVGKPIHLNPELDENGEPLIIAPTVIKQQQPNKPWLLRLALLFAHWSGCQKCLGKM